MTTIRHDYRAALMRAQDEADRSGRHCFIVRRDRDYYAVRSEALGTLPLREETSDDIVHTVTPWAVQVEWILEAQP
jgi:hypothetical protein